MIVSASKSQPGPSGTSPSLNPGWSFSESQIRRKIEHGDVGYTVKNRNCSPFNAFSVYAIIGSRLDGDQIRLSISVFTGMITNSTHPIGYCAIYRLKDFFPDKTKN